MTPDTSREWLEPDGLGGFASGTACGIRTRRYHALLLAAERPPGRRHVLVNGFDAAVTTRAGTWPITSQRYAPDVTHPEGHHYLEAFTHEPWPRWTWRLPDGTVIEQQIVARHGTPLVAVSWRLGTPRRGVTLRVRPLLSGRDSHVLHHENAALRFERREGEGLAWWRPYDDVPAVLTLANGEWRDAPEWYRRFQYDEERARGFEFLEDLASPGELTFDLSAESATWIVAQDTPETSDLLAGAEALKLARAVHQRERTRRERFATPLHRAGDAYLVRRGGGMTVIAGYPWFGEWGRDTFVSMRGLCLASGRLEEARMVLLEWARTISEGMIPNRIADETDAAEYNSVDASLWYVISAGGWLDAMARAGSSVPKPTFAALRRGIEEILEGYARGTRYGIRLDDDGLIACGRTPAPGEPDVALTWMDARVDGRAVTPRTGKPVEVQALWYNALRVGERFAARWAAQAERARAAFRTRFWNADRGCLYDVVDVDHVPGRVDGALRPNQLFTVGGLPHPLLEGAAARAVVDAVERELWTPLGPRSLAPGEPGYAPHYVGDERERAAAYHQGTVWPWLAGAFIEAWLRVRRGQPRARVFARKNLLPPLLRHLDEAGLGHASEVADGDPPHTPRGCPFQAWSVAELLRLQSEVLGKDPS